MPHTETQRIQLQTSYAHIIAELTAKYGAGVAATETEPAQAGVILQSVRYTVDDAGLITDMVATVIILQPADADGDRVYARKEVSIW